MYLKKNLKLLAIHTKFLEIQYFLLEIEPFESKELKLLKFYSEAHYCFSCSDYQPLH